MELCSGGGDGARWKWRKADGGGVVTYGRVVEGEDDSRRREKKMNGLVGGCILVVVCNNFWGTMINQDEGIFAPKYQIFKRVVFSK